MRLPNLKEHNAKVSFQRERGGVCACEFDRENGVTRKTCSWGFSITAAAVCRSQPHYSTGFHSFGMFLICDVHKGSLFPIFAGSHLLQVCVFCVLLDGSW